MNQNSLQLSSESTQKYQKQSLNQPSISEIKVGTIFKAVQQNMEIFEIPYHLPYDILEVRREVEIEKYQSVLGVGSFANVYISLNIKKLEQCALKIHSQFSENQILEIRNEYIIQQKLNKKFPQFFLRLIDKVYITQEWQDQYSSYAGIEQGITSLDKYIKETNIDVVEFQSIYHSVLDSILKMHSIHIAHRDIKPQNIIYTNNGWVLGDFGCAIIYQKTKGKYKIAGTKAYLPKYIRNQINHVFYDIEIEMNLFENDIYAFLVTILQVYQKSYNIQKIQYIIENQDDPCMKTDSFEYLFQIYQKPYSYIKTHLQINMNRIPINFNFVQQQQYAKFEYFKRDQTITDYKLEKFIKYYYFNKSFQTDFIKFSEKEYLLEYFQLQRELCEDEKIAIENFCKYIPILQINFKVANFGSEIFEINKNTQKWQYDAIQFYFLRLSNIRLQLQLCQKYQSITEKHSIELKFFEIDRLMFIGNSPLAELKMKQLEQQQYFLEEISILKLNSYKQIYNGTWLDQASSLISLLRIAKQHLIHLIFLQQKINFYLWFYNQSFLYVKNHFVYLLENEAFNNFQQFCIIIGISAAQVSENVKILQLRNADCFGIYFILNQLIQMSKQSVSKELIINLYLEMIKYFENNLEIEMYFWEILLEFSIDYYNLHKYELSFHYAQKSLSKINQQNYVEIITVNIIIYYSLLRLFKYEKAQEIFSSIIYQINTHNLSNALAVSFLQKLIKGMQILFEQQNYIELNLEQVLIKSVFNKAINKNIQFLICMLEWEILLILQNSEILKQKLNQDIFQLFKNGILEDKQIIQVIQNIKIISRQEFKNGQKNIKMHINTTARLMQNLIIYQDLYCFAQTETLNVLDEIQKYNVMAQKENKNKNQAIQIHFEKVLYQF